MEHPSLPPSAKEVADKFASQIVDAATAFCRAKFNSATVHAEMLPDCPLQTGDVIREYTALLRQDYGFVGVIVTLNEDGTLGDIKCQKV
jgi:hypothetical protein